MQNEIIDIQFLRSLAPFTNRDTAISKLQSLTWSVGKPAVATYKVGSETRGLLAIGIADGVGKCRILADDEDFQTLKVYTEALNKKVDDYIEVTDTWKEVVDSWRSVTDDRLVELEGKSHVQNTDTGTTSPTFQVDSTSNGPKLKGKGGDLELRNAGDTDYAGLTLGDITIKGNVTQEGDTFISKAETVEINDNLLLINKGEVGAGVTKGIAGIEIDRGTLPNYQIIFDESDKRFKAGEVGNIWPLALRDEEVNMVDGMFVTWDSTTKRLKTTNIVPSNRKLFFTDSNSYLQLVSHDFSGSELVQTLAYTNARGSLFVSAGTSCLNLDTDKTSFRFYKNIIVPSSIEADTDMVFKRNGTTKLTLKDTVAQFTVPVTATTFNRASDGSEVLYHADIVDDLVTGGTGKVLSAEQGKLLSSKVNEIGDTYLPLSAGSGKHVTGDLYLDQKIYMKNLKPIYVQDSKGNNMQVLQGATLDGEEVIQLGASSKIRVESVTDFSKAVKFKDTMVLGSDSKLYYEVSSSSSRIILDPAGGNIVLGNVNVQDMKFSTAVGKDLYHLEGTTPYKIWTAHSFDPDSKANRINPVVEQTLTLNTSTTGYKVKLGADDTGYPGMFVSTQAGVSKSSLYYSPKSDAWEIFTGAQSGVIATQNWVIDQVPTIFYARGFEVRKYNAAVNLDSDLLYGGAAVNYSDLTYWTNAPEGFSYGTVYQLGLQDYTNLNAQLAFDIIHTSDTDQKTNHLWFRTSGKAGYGVAGWKRVVTADELEGYVPSGDLSNYYTKTQSDARYWTKTELVDPATKSGNNNFTGNNTFQAGKFNVGPFEVTSSGSLLSNISSPAGSSWSRSLVFRANNDITSSLVFGGFNSIDDTSAGYVYIGIGDINYQTAQYKLYSGRLEVPNIWALKAGNYNVLNINTGNNYIGLGSNSLVPYIVSSNSDLRHRRFSATDTYKDYIIWDAYNLPTPASTTDLANYLPLAGGTLTGQLTIKQSIDIKLRLQSTDADNYCIIQAIDSQASQLGVFGYAGDKWAIGHGGTYYEIWDKYNLSDPLKKSEAATLYYPYNGRGYLSITSSGRPVMSNNQGYAVKDKDGNEKEVLWMGADNSLHLGNTSQYTLNILNLRCVTLTHNGNPIATQNYVTNQLANYLPLTGGTISSSKSNPLTINSTHVSQSSIDFSRGGVNKGTIGFYESLGSFLQNVTGEILAVKSDGAYYGVNINSLRKLATVTDLNNYLPLTGGNLTGKLSIKSSGSNLLILDSSSSTESVIHFLRSSTKKGAVGYYDNIGAFIYNFPSNTYLFVKDDGKPYVGTRADYKKILTETDITGYATQTWVNSQNFVKSTSTRKVKDIQIVDTLPTTQASGVLYLVVK